MVLICSVTPSTPSASMACGVGAASNSAGVALFTPTSVACADSATATSRVKASRYCSSVVGRGLAADRIENIASCCP